MAAFNPEVPASPGACRLFFVARPGWAASCCQAGSPALSAFFARPHHVNLLLQHLSTFTEEVAVIRLSISPASRRVAALLSAACLCSATPPLSGFQGTDPSTNGQTPQAVERVRVLSFNILQGGGDASNVGFPDDDFGGSRIDEIAAVIIFAGADIAGIQEDAAGDSLLDELNRQSSGWNRYGTVYARWSIEPLRRESRGFGLTVCRINSPAGRTIHFVNGHWSPAPYGPDIAQAMIRDGTLPANADEIDHAIVQASGKADGYRGYEATIRAVQLADPGMPVIVTGDFNEPSHLDWTDRYASEGEDRWVGNPNGMKLRFRASWSGSQRMAGAGLADAWRIAHPDEVAEPGHTWTPEYPPGTPGRRPPADQIRDRIDIIYFSKGHFSVRAATVIGESKEFSARPFPQKWPSDHRAVLAELVLETK
jgi:endonuclease/exonuclease/phosphatase family metal-dependent hydrolase